MKTLILTIAAILFVAATPIFTANRPVTMSSVYNNDYGSKAVDNNFDTFCHTSCAEVPWVNI